MHYKKEYTELILTIDETYHGQTILDIFQNLHLSRKTIHLLQQHKAYQLNGRYVPVTTAVNKNDLFTVTAYTTGLDYQPQPYPLDIVYEDELLCIVNKPAHTIIYPEHKDGLNTLCNYVAYHYLQTRQYYPVRCLHRLDKDTTGLVMFSKCSLLQPCFDSMISSKAIRKTYLAAVTGHFSKKALTVSKPIGHDRHHKQKMIISSTGKKAVTHIRQKLIRKDYSLVECQIETGRKHQIRVHLSSLSHPLLGDELYGNKSPYIDRMALHAWRLQFEHPLTHKKMDIICDIPDDMKKLF